jgi:NAD(P) transhydrogenase subunit alpha
MDVISSQATITGYSAVLRAAQMAPRVFPMLTAPAGTLEPARVIIVGADVAGLQAIATARRLGARVEVCDARSAAVREKVESLGATMLVSADAEKPDGAGPDEEQKNDDKAALVEVLEECLGAADVVITTIGMPGITAPKLISETMVERMQPGSVIIDLAAESGGNCDLTVPGKTISHNGVQVDGPVNLASEAALHASVLYARSLLDVLDLLVDGEDVAINRDNEVIDATLLTHAGKLVHRDSIEIPADALTGD